MRSLLSALLLLLTIFWASPSEAFFLRGGSGLSSGLSGMPTVSLTPSEVYSVRRAVTGYSGHLFRIVRPSDSATFDVDANTDGTPNATAACSFISPYISAHVNTLYGQMGTGYNATAATGPYMVCGQSIRGIQGITFDSAASTSFTIPAGITGSGQSVSIMNVASYESTNNAEVMQLGAAYNSAGSVSVGLGTGNSNRFAVLNGISSSPFFAFNYGAYKGRSQPQFTLISSGASSQVVYQDTTSTTLAANDGGTWVGGKIGVGGNGYIFFGEWYATAIFPGPLTSSDAAALKSWADTKFDLLTSPTQQLIFAGNSIVQGYKATLNQNYPTQAEPNFSSRIRVSNQGVSGQLLSQSYANRSQYFSAYDASLTKNFIVVEEPTNDIGGAASGSITGISSTLWTNYTLPFIQQAQAAGFIVLVPTTLPRTGTSWGGSSTDQSQKESERQAYNTLVRNNAATYGYTVLDFANISVLSDPTNVTYYNDGLHPTSAGYLAMANYFVSVFNPLLAANDNPSPNLFAANDNMPVADMPAAIVQRRKKAA